MFVDATAIPADRGGVGRYLLQLIPALAARGARLTIACSSRDEELLTRLVPGSNVVAVPSVSRGRGARLIWEQTGLPRLARSSGADLIFSPHYTMPVRARLPVVVTLHDATFFSHPRLHTRLKRMFFRWWIRWSLSHAAGCLVPSRATESEILRWARPRDNVMTVAYHGVDGSVFHAPRQEDIDAAAELVGASRWITFLGTLEPRKNVPSLVRAFDAIDDASLRLVLAGGKGWDAELDEAVSTATARERIVRLGYVDDSDLPGLLGGSALFVYPSLGEGFGLPVLEAMACGAVVLTTPLLALPEVGGDVALYSDPDPLSLADGIRQGLGGAQAGRRQRGLRRAARFSWAASAGIHLDVFRAAVA